MQRSSLEPRAEPERRDLAPSNGALLCDIRVIADRARFDALEAEWNALFARVARPDQLFQSFNWLWHWANHFLGASTRLSIVTGWRGGRLVMAWPLVVRHSLGLLRLGWMGEPASQYGDALVEPGALAHAMLRQGWRAACSQGADVAFLRKTRRTSQAASLFAELGAPSVSSFAPYLDFAGAKTFEEVQKRFSAKARSSRRRLMRRLEEAGTIAFLDEARGEEARALVARTFALKRQGLAQRGRYSPALEDPAMEAFFRDAMSDDRRPVGSLFNAISCDGVVIGVALSFVCKSEGFGHILAHDVGFNKQGVGVILAERIFGAAHGRGIGRFDMLAPNDAFKMEWASGEVGVDDWAIPLTLKGTFLVRLWLGGVRGALKRIADAAPARLGAAVWPAYRWLKGARRAA
ncbi:MAG: GNAT family N-acetyltransferase [Hyphomicrobiales bacterium]